MVLITFVMLVTTDLVLTVIGALLIPTIAALSHFYNMRANELATRSQEMRAQVSGVAHESFDGALVVKTLGLEAEETERFDAKSQELRDELIGLGSVRAIFDPLLEALPNLAVIAILVAGTYRVQSGALAIGELVTFSYLFTQLAFPIRAVGWILGDMPRAVVGWDRVRNVLEATDELTYGKADLDGHGRPAEVDVRKVVLRLRGWQCRSGHRFRRGIRPNDRGGGADGLGQVDDHESSRPPCRPPPGSDRDRRCGHS